MVRVLGASLLGGWTLPAMAARTVPVRSRSELARAISQIQPGDTIVMADGRWEDVQIQLTAAGSAELPITLTAQTPGKVILTGRSNVKLLGSHLTVRGLVFKDGHAPNSEVIIVGDHRHGPDSAHCRITECTILNFNPDTKGSEGIWVSLSGSQHRVDHCYFEGKTDKGPTLAILLDKVRSAPNQHLVEFNHFGPRPDFGGNGAETIRIGTGAFSTQISATRIEHNLFEACDGELEIISIKSWRNLVRGNVFLRCKGTLTFRQGQQNLAEGNVFFGGGVDDTGGIRIISVDQTVKNNLMMGLRGTGMRSALSMMNGAPGATVGNYAPVVRALMQSNTFIDVSAITMGLGANAERSQAPTSSLFQDNLIVGGPKDLFVISSPITGIAFTGNVISGIAQAPASSGFEGHKVPALLLTDSWELPIMKPVAGAGSSMPTMPFQRAAVGPNYGA
jgi:poly(beta-D-mannuronate) lyase